MDYKFPKDVPPLAKDLICKMLNPDPNQRITIPAALNHNWIKQQKQLREIIQAENYEAE